MYCCQPGIPLAQLTFRPILRMGVNARAAMRDRRDRVTRECERQYDLLVKEALEEERRRLSRSVFHVQTEQEQHAELVREVARTLAADWHAESAPAWAARLPVELPMCESLIYNNCNQLKLLGYFGRSMLWNDWN